MAGLEDNPRNHWRRRARGTAIAIGHPHDGTISALQIWLLKLEGRGVAIVPLTEILKRRSENKDNPAISG